MSSHWKKSWGTKIRRKSEPEPKSNQSTFLFDMELHLIIKIPRATQGSKLNISRRALTVIIARFMSKHPDWASVGSLLLNRLRKYIQPTDDDWNFDIQASKEYWKLDERTHLCRHCAPLQDRRNYPNEPVYDELNFDGFIGNFELSYTMKLFLSPAIFGASDFYTKKRFERTSPWYRNDADENNLSTAVNEFSGADEELEDQTLSEHKAAWDTLFFESSDEETDEDDDYYSYRSRRRGWW